MAEKKMGREKLTFNTGYSKGDFERDTFLGWRYEKMSRIKVVPPVICLITYFFIVLGE